MRALMWKHVHLDTAHVSSDADVIIIIYKSLRPLLENIKETVSLVQTQFTLRSRTMFTMSFMSTFVIFAVAITAAYSAKLPSSWRRCSKSSPEFNICVAMGVEEAIHSLKEGSTELGLASFDPLLIPELIIGEGSGPVNVQQNFKNVKLYGLTGSKVLSQIVDLEHSKLYAKSITPELRFDADYAMKGRVMLLPIVGSGRGVITLINTKINHTLTMEPFQRKGKTFMKVVDYTITLRPERVHFSFEKLFNGDERLGNEINNVLNDNNDAVFTDVRGGYEKGLGLIFQGLANRVFTRVPLNDIFLE